VDVRSNTIVPVEEARTYLQGFFPRYVDCSASDFQLTGVSGSKLDLTLGGSPYRVEWLDGFKFKKVTGIDAPMLGRLSQTVRDAAFGDLMSRVQAPLTAKIRQDRILDISDRDKSEKPDYNKWMDLLLTKTQPVGVANTYIAPDHLSFALVTSATKEPPKRKGDVIHSGILAEFNGRITVREYSYRLACLNGACASRMGGAVVITEDTFTEVMDRTLQQSSNFLDGLIQLDEHPLADSGALVGGLSRSRILNANQVAAITSRLATLQSGATEYDLVNLMTAIQHESNDPQAWAEVGGKAISFLHGNHCASCGHHI